MLKLIRQKIINKMWLTVCLVLGMSFLVAAFSCQPMFKAGSLDKMLERIFTNYIDEENEYPTVISRGGSYSSSNRSTVADVNAGIKGYQDTWEKYLSDLDIVETQTRMNLTKETSQGSYGSKGNYLTVSYMPEMTSHIEILTGEDYDNYSGTSEEYPCIISQGVMDLYGLTVGETIDYVNWEDKDGVTLKLVIAGIFKESERSDLFWYIEPNEFEEEIFVSEESFNEIVARYECPNIYYNHFVLLDYKDINSTNIDNIEYYIEQFKELDDNVSVSFNDMLSSYRDSRKTVNITLWVLELPVLGMVLAFIYMVSKQIVETERNEIAMLKSRGINRTQVIIMYAAQSGVLSVAGIILGIPLGYLLCKLAAGTTDFLTFSTNDIGLYHFTVDMLGYGVVAALVGILFILIPVFGYSKISIVEHKSEYNNQKMAWEKYFIDILLLALALYLLYNFNQGKEGIRSRAIAGAKMDPMIFLDSILFIIAFGLVALRLTHYLVKLVYFIGRKKWKPAVYASFLQISRTFGRQGFISVFMILTVSLGLFNANAARTINRNNEDRIIYEAGADAVIQEEWAMRVFFPYLMPEADYEWKEPDYIKYTELIDSGLCESATRVICNDETIVAKGRKSMPNCMLRGINTKEFGETAYLKEELNTDVHWYTYLNEMSQRPNGVIISRNLAEEMEIGVGDVIKCTRNGEITSQAEKVRGVMNGYVCAVVDSWPGYDRYYYEEGKLKERYLVVANYASVVKAYKISPYQVWVKLSDGTASGDVYDALKEKGINMESFTGVDEEISDMKSSSLIQITNGMFTLSFIIAIVLCAVGFLIYWISSIRQRELLFGVYRAMGMSVREINRMLVNEHIFSTLLSVIAGGLVGMASTLLFVKLFGIIYLPEKHNLDIYIYFEPMDVVKLAAVIAVMILVCMMVLRRLVKSMDITQALKLGEE